MLHPVSKKAIAEIWREICEILMDFHLVHLFIASFSSYGQIFVVQSRRCVNINKFVKNLKNLKSQTRMFSDEVRICSL